MVIYEWKYGYVNKTGKSVVPCIYDWIKAHDEEFSYVRRDGKYGIINYEGDVIIPCI